MGTKILLSLILNKKISLLYSLKSITGIIDISRRYDYEERFLTLLLFIHHSLASSSISWPWAPISRENKLLRPGINNSNKDPPLGKYIFQQHDLIKAKQHRQRVMWTQFLFIVLLSAHWHAPDERTEITTELHFAQKRTSYDFLPSILHKNWSRQTIRQWRRILDAFAFVIYTVFVSELRYTLEIAICQFVNLHKPWWLKSQCRLRYNRAQNWAKPY